jgi:hypothetical protein
MRFLTHLGDALLTKLVPGIDAKAGCGRCKQAYYRCACCGGHYQARVYYYDDCGNPCGTYCRALLACLDRPTPC